MPRCKIFKTVILKKRFIHFISAIYFQNNSKHSKIIKRITIIIIVKQSVGVTARLPNASLHWSHRTLISDKWMSELIEGLFLYIFGLLE